MSADALTRRRRGIYRARLPDVEEYKRVLVVSWNALNAALKQPICAVITAEERERKVPTYVVLEPHESDGGVNTTSFILCHALHTLKEADIDARAIGAITATKMEEVEAALARALDFTGANDPLPSM
jgi:mRNA-degrading endonuclease toxin of MazEF toxin-antitoxin module